MGFLGRHRAPQIHEQDSAEQYARIQRMRSGCRCLEPGLDQWLYIVKDPWFLYEKRMACPWRIEYESALFVANGCLNFARPAPYFGVGFFTRFPENMWINICTRFWRSRPHHSNIYAFLRPKKVVISSFPVLKARVLLSATGNATAINLNNWHRLNFYGIHNIYELLSNFIYWQDICRTCFAFPNPFIDNELPLKITPINYYIVVLPNILLTFFIAFC